MTALVIRVNPARAAWWRDHLQSLLPEIDCRLWNDPGDPDEIDIAVVWKPPPGGLKRFRNLSLIVSIGAGVDHLENDPEWPRHVPVMRTIGDDLQLRMREYVLLHVLRLHRCLPETEAAARERRWAPLITPLAHERQVGVMGLGHLGADSAAALAGIGFKVRGWSRSAKDLRGIEVFAGDKALAAFLEKTDILVCLLPLTTVTRKILCADLFAKLPRGAAIINAARGGHLVAPDLLAALDQGHLRAATLDVFEQEPLPANHPFWAHPKILVTPHIGSLIDPIAGGKAIATNLKMFLRGKKPLNMVDMLRGY